MRDRQKQPKIKKVAQLVDIKTGIFVGIQFDENAHQPIPCNTEWLEKLSKQKRYIIATTKYKSEEDAKSPQIYLNFEVVFHY